MVSRSETARALLTQGEIMQLPETDEIVMLAGAHPIRARKARYYADPRLKKRVETPPAPRPSDDSTNLGDWTGRLVEPAPKRAAQSQDADETDGNRETEGGVRREPDLPEHEEIARVGTAEINEFEFEERRDQDQAGGNRKMAERMRVNARQAALDPNDGIDL